MQKGVQKEDKSGAAKKEAGVSGDCQSFEINGSLLAKNTLLNLMTRRCLRSSGRSATLCGCDGER